MAEESIPALMAPARQRDNPLTRSAAGICGMIVLAILVLACVGTLPWTLGTPTGENQARYEQGALAGALLPPAWAPHDETEQAQLRRFAELRAAEEIARADPDAIDPPAPTEEQIRANTPRPIFGTDKLGRDLFIRCLTGGGISIGIGIAAAAISVVIGTLYGALAAYIGGRVDAVLMRIVDVLYGLPYILLVVLLAVAGDAIVSEMTTKQTARQKWIEEQAVLVLHSEGQTEATRVTARDALEIRPDLQREIRNQLEQEIDAGRLTRLKPTELTPGQRKALEVGILLVAIGGVSWLTMARVVRGQVLSLKAQPFMEAARALGVPARRQFLLHLLPNLLGPIIVYATLTVPQAILQESFLSFLGIGVQEPLPSWGNLAADGLKELNTIKTRWWLLLFPCLLLATTLLALNFVGEGLREAFDPKRARN